MENLTFPGRQNDIGLGLDICFEYGRWSTEYERWLRVEVSEGLREEWRKENTGFYLRGCKILCSMVPYKEMAEYALALDQSLKVMEKKHNFVRIKMPPVQERTLVRELT